MRRANGLAATLLALAVACPGAGAQPAASGAAPTRPGAARRVPAPVPAANFLVEWRLQPADARPAARGDVVITSGSAVTGTSGFGPGAVTVGTARAAAPQALRVANGKEGAIRFDRSETHTVYDMAWAGSASASASTDGSTQVVSGAASSVSAGGASRSSSQSHQSGVQSHEVEIHRVDGLRVTPHWTHGDTLELDVALTHAAPAAVSRQATAGALARGDVEFQSTVQASFDEWLTVASVGDGGDELQIRVSWR
jgi:hypothetical protein